MIADPPGHDRSAPSAPTPGASAPDASGIARLFEMTSDLLAAISLDGRFTLLNPAWEDALGLAHRGADGPADAGAGASGRSSSRRSR